MTLRNETSSEFSAFPRVDLPPLQDPNIFKSSGRPSPLEPDASTRSTNHVVLTSQQTTAFDLDFPNGANTRLDGKETPKKSATLTDRALGGSSPQSLRKILDDDIEIGQSLLSKKRQRAENSKDDFVQLPQPPKKAKAAKQAVPPIIIGLFEPPPNAALFPPIASSAFHDSHGRNSLNTAPPVHSKDGPPKNVPPDVGKPEQPSSKSKKALVQPRNKWTEDETNQLLLGVARHGIGAWTNILRDAEFKFNSRTTVDLKDRWRICCPKEFRIKGKITPHHESRGKSMRIAKSSGLMLEDILAGSGEDSFNDEKEGSGLQKQAPKSRAHRRNMEDLAELGIREPFKKSQRRERRPFSEQEDQNIIQGFKEFGNAWSLIQKDPRFHLQDRRPTDLRDRLRNKYPKLYSSDSMDRKALKESVNSSERDRPSVSHPSSQNSETALNEEKQQAVDLIGSFDAKSSGKQSIQLPNPSYNFPSSFTELLGGQAAIEPPDTLSFSQGFEWGDPLTSFGVGEMDISRLLLDEETNWHTNTSNMYSKQKYTDINSLCTSIPSQYPPVYSMATFESLQPTNPSIRGSGPSTE